MAALWVEGIPDYFTNVVKSQKSVPERRAATGRVNTQAARMLRRVDI
jgi:hypothetical protein